MIPIVCNCSPVLDKYENMLFPVWQTELICRPQAGDYILSIDGHEAKITKILHCKKGLILNLDVVG